VTRRVVVVPRCRWPAAWFALTSARAEFTTGNSTAKGLDSGTVDVIVTSKGESVLARLGLKANGRSPRDPWPDPQQALRAREGVATWARGPAPDDPLEAAFRAYQRRVKGWS
jgi:hypothetical protein